MSEDDDGKTVFQPSKRKSIQKKGTVKKDVPEKEIPEKNVEKKDVPKKDVAEKDIEKKEGSQKDIKSTPAMQFNIGDVLNNVYKIKRFIAKGGMGEVYEAVNVHNTDERVAIKVMLPEFAADERVIAMFAKEAGTLTRLHHEAIVPYRLSSRDELGRPFIVTAYVDGPSLEDQFKEFSPTEEELGRLTFRLAEGLGKAHSFGAIHRDIAPDNVLLVDGNPGLPKIIDFGIAQDARTENKSATIIGDGFAGKLNYVAPEQLGEYGSNIGPWTDIYSLALTMLAVATQKHADMGGSIASAVKKRMTVPDISSIPPRFRRAFKAALQPDPTNRPQTMLGFMKLMDSPAETEKVSSFIPLNSDVKEDIKTDIKTDVKETTDTLKLAGKGKLIGAALGAILLMWAVSAFMMRGGSPEAGPVKTVVNTPPSEPSVEPTVKQPPVQRLTPAMLDSAAAETRCSWLAFQGKDRLATFNPSTDVLKILGGAANVSATGSSTSRSLRGLIGRGVNLDLSEIAIFDPSLCDAVAAIQDIKNRKSLISSNERSRVIEVKTHRVSDGKGGFVDADFAKISVEVSNIEPSKFITLLSVDPRGLLVPIANGRAQIQMFVDRYGGIMKEDGFTLTFPTGLETGEKEGYGFVVIIGEGKFPQTFFSDTNANNDGFPLSPRWFSQFKSLARSNNWTSDIFWYSIVDEVED